MYVYTVPTKNIDVILMYGIRLAAINNWGKNNGKYSLSDLNKLASILWENRRTVKFKWYRSVYLIIPIQTIHFSKDFKLDNLFTAGKCAIGQKYHFRIHYVREQWKIEKNLNINKCCWTYFTACLSFFSMKRKSDERLWKKAYILGQTIDRLRKTATILSNNWKM